MKTTELRILKDLADGAVAGCVDFKGVSERKDSQVVELRILKELAARSSKVRQGKNLARAWRQSGAWRLAGEKSDSGWQAERGDTGNAEMAGRGPEAIFGNTKEDSTEV